LSREGQAGKRQRNGERGEHDNDSGQSSKRHDRSA
jgi:hypothetical protein